jgi:DNA topoisomerase-1
VNLSQQPERQRQFRQAPQVRCIDPACVTNAEPTLDIGPCPTCAALGRDGRLIAQRSPRTLKRFARCSEYGVEYENGTCKTSYPLPQRGDLEATGESCTCGAPVVVAHTKRGPWKVCVDPSCPLKAESVAAPKRPAARGKRRTGGAS